MAKSFRLHPVLWALYGFFRIVSRISLHIFYRRRTVLNPHHAQFDGPAIVVSNHPSTLLDVLNVGINIPRSLFFLANYGLFKHPVSNWVLRRLYCIPVKRREDVAEGQARDLGAMFEQCYQHLEKGGLLFIAPEGTSWMNRFVREIKPGTARIALGAEGRNDWSLDLRIIPIGLSYSAPNLFRSDLVVNIGEPVWPRDWAEAWKKRQGAANQGLTAYLQERLQQLSLHARDEVGEALLSRAELVLQNSDPLPLKASFERSQRLLPGLLDNQAVAEKLNRYFADLFLNKVSDLGVATAGRTDLADALLLLLGWPFFLIGYVFWYLPCRLPLLLAQRMNLYVGYDSNVKVLAGIFTFPLALWGGFRLLRWAGATAPWAWAGLVALIGLGYFTEQYLYAAQRWMQRRRAERLDKHMLDDLKKQRADLDMRFFRDER